MSKTNFMDDELVSKEYDKWIHGPTLFGHYQDRVQFYEFFLSCVRYVNKIKFVKKEIAWKSLDINILKEHLYDDLAELRRKNYAVYEERVHEIIVKFEMLLEYEENKYLPLFM